MGQESELPEAIRKELADLRGKLDSAVQQRNSAQKGTEERHRAKDEVVQIQKKMKSLIRTYREQDPFGMHERHGDETTGRHVHGVNSPEYEDLSEDSDP
jgi:inhibitor of KinA sporulation pathway (predicted exonuclease)